MVCIESYTEKLIGLLKQKFAQRLVYVGLQGSYLRGEANESSDMDIMAVMEDLETQDLESYKQILVKAGDYDRSCGFLCGRAELMNWNPLEICHLTHTTKDLYGRLSDLVPDYTKDDEKNYIKLSINNLYHELCHARVHSCEAEQKARLCNCFKSLFFILQNIYYFNTGRFYQTKKELLNAALETDQKALARALEIKNAEYVDLGNDFSLLFHWCKSYAENF